MAGGLATATMTSSTGIITHHHQKVDIQVACRSQAQFTHANNTPFMIKPLASELQWLGTELSTFDQIATGKFHPTPPPSQHKVHYKYCLYWHANQQLATGPEH